MDVTIDLLDNAAFREARKGYNTQDVDEFIEQVKEGVQGSEAQVAEMRARAEAAEGRAVEAERRAAEAAEHGSDPVEETAVGRALVLAQSTADATVKAAEEEAARKVSAAEEQAARLLAEARDATDRVRADAEREAVEAQREARTRVLNELHELEAERDSLQGDVEALAAHADEQRERVRFAASELQRLLDDPAALRPISLPEPTPPHEEPADVQPAAGAEEAPTDAEPTSDASPEPEAPDAAETDQPSPDASGVAPRGDADEQRPLAPAPGAVDEAASAEPAGGADDGPPTQPVDVLAERGLGEDDAYLAELRKAMTDDSPLGPREGNDAQSQFENGDEVPRSRFGRRR